MKTKSEMIIMIQRVTGVRVEKLTLDIHARTEVIIYPFQSDTPSVVTQ